ncbi:MAG: SEL1-like repeat protein [Magnetovibrio sp.]|nr:SEL1-like repeat protein [Magnetovibrio sp.]
MSKANGAVRWVALGLVLSVMPVLGGCAANAAKTKTPQTQENKPLTAVKSPLKSNLLGLAESGDIGAQYDLGLTLIETDPKAAAKWLERAALQGQGSAAYELGLMQDDARRAVEWLSMASAMGHVGAHYQLGEAYLYGRGTAKEPGWGLMWFERAARAGDGEAQYAMGVSMLSGVAGLVQREEALVWLLIAKNNQRPGLDLLISALKSRMSSSTIETIDGRVSAWSHEAVSDKVGDRATLRFAQYALGRLGFKAGPSDGIPGERTERAIKAFRIDQGLGGGALDGRMLYRLRERLAVMNR